MLIRTRILLAAAFVVGSATAASAQGHDPDPETRSYPAFAEAGAAGYYMGRMEGSMAEAAMRSPDRSRLSGLRMIGQPMPPPRVGPERSRGYLRSNGPQY
jgi:hypothetical protein